MDQLALIVFVALKAAGFAHLLWALGFYWPYKSDRELARAILARKETNAMPPRWITLLAAVGFFAASLWALLLRSFLPVSAPKLIILFGGIILAYFFVIRGALDVLPRSRKRPPSKPAFAISSTVFAPAYIFLGFSFALLVAAWPNWTWRLSLIFG